MQTQNKDLNYKLGLLKLAMELDNVSSACKILGYSRTTFYRYKALYSKGGEDALLDVSRKKPNPKNQVLPHISEAVLSLSLEIPEFGKQRASNELRNRNILMFPSGVRGIWLRNNIETYPKRLKSLSDKVSKENMILSASQVVALERSRPSKASHGAIETFYPGYLVAQDTCYVGYLKGVGFVYLQTA